MTCRIVSPADSATAHLEPFRTGGHLTQSDGAILAGPFFDPAEIVFAHELTREEKRALLAAWASDARAVESNPALRSSPYGGPPVRLDDVLSALRALDRSDGGPVMRIERGPEPSARSSACMLPN